jgi:phospholipid/cholesterol/gamma-HCH transport system ATP-binding protein
LADLEINKPEESETIISVRDLTIGYGDETIMENVSFKVNRGEIFVILGRSGCGKTTLFKAMIGLIPARSGEIQIEDEVVTPVSEGGSQNILRSIGVLFQSGALFSSMTVAENVAFPLKQFTAFPQNTIETIVELKLAQVGLAGHEGALPEELSGGMQKRAALARAMALDPVILFFDEPSAGLDPMTSAELDNTIIKINRILGTTMVIITHEPASVSAVAHRAIMLDAGQKGIVAEGAPDELRRHPDKRVRGFFQRETNGNGSVDRKTSLEL